jgi:hypothetical protein
MGHVYYVNYLLVRRVRTGQRLLRVVKGEGVGGEKPGSRAGEGRSLLVEKYGIVEPAQGGDNTTLVVGGTSRREERRGLAFMMMSRRRKTRYIVGFEYFPHPRGLFGSGHCDHALLYRYPLSLGTPSIRMCEPI